MRTIDFEYDDRHFTVKAVATGEQTMVRVFESDSPANSVIYTVSGEVAQDAIKDGYDPVGSLMQTAESDFRNWSDWRKSQAKASS